MSSALHELKTGETGFPKTSVLIVTDTNEENVIPPPPPPDGEQDVNKVKDSADLAEGTSSVPDTVPSELIGDVNENLVKLDPVSLKTPLIKETSSPNMTANDEPESSYFRPDFGELSCGGFSSGGVSLKAEEFNLSDGVVHEDNERDMSSSDESDEEENVPEVHDYRMSVMKSLIYEESHDYRTCLISEELFIGDSQIFEKADNLLTKRWCIKEKISQPGLFMMKPKGFNPCEKSHFRAVEVSYDYLLGVLSTELFCEVGERPPSWWERRTSDEVDNLIPGPGNMILLAEEIDKCYEHAPDDTLLYNGGFQYKHERDVWYFRTFRAMKVVGIILSVAEWGKDSPVRKMKCCRIVSAELTSYEQELLKFLGEKNKLGKVTSVTRAENGLPLTYTADIRYPHIFREDVVYRVRSELAEQATRVAKSYERYGSKCEADPVIPKHSEKVRVVVPEMNRTGTSVSMAGNLVTQCHRMIGADNNGQWTFVTSKQNWSVVPMGVSVRQLSGDKKASACATTLLGYTRRNPAFLNLTRKYFLASEDLLKNMDCIINMTPSVTWFSKKTIHNEGAFAVVHDEPMRGGVDSSDNFQYRFKLKEKPVVKEPVVEESETLKRRALSVVEEEEDEKDDLHQSQVTPGLVKKLVKTVFEESVLEPTAFKKIVKEVLLEIFGEEIEALKKARS